MNWSIRLQIVLLVVVTSVLSSICTAYLMTRNMAGIMGAAGMVPPQGQTAANPMSSTFGVAPDKEGTDKLLAAVKARQAASDAGNTTTIDLKPYVNAALTDALADSPGQKDHNFGRLPKGVHTYGGIQFDVEGVIQLAGPSLPTGDKAWPVSVTNIAIGHSCKKLHLLQGAFNIEAPGAHIPFANLILHYSDGSTETLEIAGGTHALKCTSPAVPVMLSLLATPQTELGWMDSDPYLEGNDPGEALHIYRTTLDNPKPDTSIASADFVSTQVHPAPFMVGLTLE